MSSSSRSIAAARQRRSGEVVQKPQAPPQNFKQNIGQKPQQPLNKMQSQGQGQMQGQGRTGDANLKKLRKERRMSIDSSLSKGKFHWPQ